jgi:phosphate transport system permease protein
MSSPVQLRSVEPPRLSGLHNTPLQSARLPGYFTAAVIVAAIFAAALLHLVLGFGMVSSVLLSWAALAIGLCGTSLAVEGRRRAVDRLAATLVTSAFLLALLPLVTLMWKVVSNGWSVLSLSFFTNSMRNIVGPGGGIYHAAFGTLLVTGMAGLISIPVGLLTSIYLVEYGGGRTARAVTFLVDVMTGIPSIVAGLFAYALFVLFAGEGVRMGFGGAVALSVLMVPLVVRSCEEMLKLVPHELREASYALGVPKWRTVIRVVVPTAIAGIVTGITIAIARVIGETAPLLIICGTTDSTNLNLFNGRMMTLPVFIYNSYKTPTIPPQFSIDRAWGAALVLTFIIMALNVVARLVSYFFSPKSKS